MLSAEEARALIDAIDTSTVIGLRGRALMGLMVYTFTRVGAAIQLRMQDVYVQASRSWVRLPQPRGRRLATRCFT